MAGNFMRIKPAENRQPLTSIRVIGVGGGGGNALNHMIEEGIEGVDFIAVNTDAQDLQKNLAPIKIQIGEKLTGGRGTGGDPRKGEEAAKESEEVISEKLKNSNMIFITAGMGGGTGTGAAPVIAEIAQKLGILTVGVVTTPFLFEGAKKMQKAMSGIENLREKLNSIIIIPNEKVKELNNGNISFKDAFKQADSLLMNAVKGIADIITTTGFMNVDFEDVKTVMSAGGQAVMGMGEGEGDERVYDAIKQAIENPLVDIKSIKGARGLLINFTCGEDITMEEITGGVEYLTREVSKEAEIKFGVVLDKNYEGRARVTVIATGFYAGKTNPVQVSSRGIEPPSGLGGLLNPVNPVEVNQANDDQNTNVNWINTPTSLEGSMGSSALEDFKEPTFKRNKKGD